MLLLPRAVKVYIATKPVRLNRSFDLAAVGRRKTEIEIKALAERKWSSQEARFVLRAQERSGLSVHAFAREHGLSHERLYRWGVRPGDRTRRRTGPAVLRWST